MSWSQRTNVSFTLFTNIIENVNGTSVKRSFNMVPDSWIKSQIYIGYVTITWYSHETLSLNRNKLILNNYYYKNNLQVVCFTIILTNNNIISSTTIATTHLIGDHNYVTETHVEPKIEREKKHFLQRSRNRMKDTFYVEHIIIINYVIITRWN